MAKKIILFLAIDYQVIMRIYSLVFILVERNQQLVQLIDIHTLTLIKEDSVSWVDSACHNYLIWIKSLFLKWIAFIFQVLVEGFFYIRKKSINNTINW